jgi:hypothetical protein
MVVNLTTIKANANHAKQSMELSHDSNTDSFQHLDDNNTPNDHTQHIKAGTLLPNTMYTNSLPPGFLDYLPCCGAPSPNTKDPFTQPEAPIKVEVQVAHCTFILVSSLTPHTPITDIMEVEIEMVSFFNSYHPSNA